MGHNHRVSPQLKLFSKSRLTMIWVLGNQSDLCKVFPLKPRSQLSVLPFFLLPLLHLILFYALGAVHEVDTGVREGRGVTADGVDGDIGILQGELL